MFFFTSNKDEKLITRKIETEDNVMPSSNSIMAKNLFKLSHYFDNEYYLKISKQMLHNMTDTIQNFGSGFSNWLDLYANFSENFFEIAISGKNATKKILEMHKEYIPNKLICGSTKDSDLPLLKNRNIKEKTLIYVCRNNTCKRPTEDAKKAIYQIKNIS